MYTNKLVGIILSLFCCVPAFSQSPVTVKGTVSDAANGECLISARIQTRDLTTITDEDGRYSISVPPGSVSITCTYTGYEARTVDLTIQRDTTLNIALRAGELLDASTVFATGNDSFWSSRIDALEIPLGTVKNMPVILGEADVLKTLQLYPGVQGGIEGFSGIFVRGGNSDENLYLLDGVPLYNVSHMLGVFSAFTPEAIKKITFYKGAFPSRYGGRVSSIVDIRTLDGDLYKTHGSFDIGLVSSKLHLNGPIVKGKTSFALSGRLMHTALAAPFIKTKAVPFAYYFYDVNGKIVHRFSDNDRLFLTVYHGNDVFRYQETHEESSLSSKDTENMSWGNTVAALRWNHVFSGNWSANTLLAYNRYGMNTDFRQIHTWEQYQDKELQEFSESYESKYISHINDLSISFDANGTPLRGHTVKTGLSATHHFYSPSTRFTRTDLIAEEQLSETSNQKDYQGWETSLYAEDEIVFSDRLSANLGLRFVLMTSNEAVYPSLEPRVSVRYSLLEPMAVKVGYARMSQYVHQLSSTRITLPSDLWVPVTGEIGPVTSDSGSAGVFFDWQSGWRLSLEGYYKFSRNVIDYRDGASMFGSSEGWEKMVETGHARSYGLELFAERTQGALKGWLSYTLSKSERRYPGSYINNGEWYPYHYDRRHVVSLNLEYHITDRIDLGATWSFASGAWLSVPERTVLLFNLDENKDDNRVGRDPFISVDYLSGRNNFQLPPSHLLNLSANFRRPLGRGERVISVSIYNAYNAMNPNLVYTKARKAGEALVLEKITFLPILPSINYTYRF